MMEEHKLKSIISEHIGNKALLRSNAISESNESRWPLVTKSIENMRVLLQAFSEEQKQSKDFDAISSTGRAHVVHLVGHVLREADAEKTQALTLYCAPKELQEGENGKAYMDSLRKFIHSIGMSNHVCVLDSLTVNLRKEKGCSGPYSGVSIFNIPKKQQAGVLQMIEAKLPSTDITVENGIQIKMADEVPFAQLMELWAAVNEIIATDFSAIKRKGNVQVYIKNVREVFPLRVFLVEKRADFQLTRLLQAYADQSAILRIGLRYLLHLLLGDNFWHRKNSILVAALWISFCMGKQMTIPFIDPKSLDDVPIDSSESIFRKSSCAVACSPNILGFTLLQFFHFCSTVRPGDIDIDMRTEQGIRSFESSISLESGSDIETSPMTIIHAFTSVNLAANITERHVMKLQRSARNFLVKRFKGLPWIVKESTRGYTRVGRRLTDQCMDLLRSEDFFR